MSARTPTIRSTEDNALDGELLDIRRRLADIEARLNAKTITHTPAPTPGVGYPDVQTGFFIGEDVTGGTAYRILYEDADHKVADDPAFTVEFSGDANSIVSYVEDDGGVNALSLLKPFHAHWKGSQNSDSYSLIDLYRECTVAIIAGFGVGYSASWKSSSGNKMQCMVVEARYDGAVDTSQIVMRVTIAEAPTDAAFFRASLDFEAVGNILAITAGKGFRVKEGSNCKQGQAVLVAGTKTVACTSVTANSRIFLTGVGNTNEGWLSVGTIVAGTSFVIQSSNGADTRTINYEIFEPA